MARKKKAIVLTEEEKIANQLKTVTTNFRGTKFDSDGSGKGQTDYVGGSVTIQSSTDGSEYYVVCDCGIAKHLTVDNMGRLSWTKIDGENVTNVNGTYICERCGKKYDLVEGTNIKNAASNMVFNAANVDDVPVKE